MIPLHDLMDDILIILFDNDSVDLNIVFTDRYYGKLTHAAFSEVINHLIDENLILPNQDSTVVSITTKGREFVNSGGYQGKLKSEIEKAITEQERLGLEPKVNLSFKEYLSYMNFPGKSHERKDALKRSLYTFLLLMATFLFIQLLRYLFN